MNKASFEYIDIIGRGGFGKVWKVYNKKYKILYAMKEMDKSKIIDKRSERSIIYERELLSRMNHPFISNIHFAFQDIDHLYLVMDLLTGGDLRYHLCRHRNFNEETTKFFIACIVLGLEYLHTNNILHRDIKPENLVLDHKGYVKITDFGIAKAYQKENAAETSGTPGYMSPEVLNAKNHTVAVDYFALGIIAFEFMNGIRPYLGKTRKEIKEKIMAKQIEIKLNEIPSDWSIEAVDFINRTMQRKPKSRLGYNGVHELKNHPWLKFFNWRDLYLEKIQSPFIPKRECNYDMKYCTGIQKIGINTKERYEKIMKSAVYQIAFDDYYYFDRVLKEKASNSKDSLRIKEEMKLQSDYINPHSIFKELEAKEQKAFNNNNNKTLRDDSMLRPKQNLSLYDKHYINHNRCLSANARPNLLRNPNDFTYFLNKNNDNNINQADIDAFIEGLEARNSSTRRTGSGNNYY